MIILIQSHSDEFDLDSDGDDEGEPTAKQPETVNFVVMLKKNNKPQVNFFVDSAFGEIHCWNF